MSATEMSAPRLEPWQEDAFDLEERLARLRLARSRNVGPRTYAHLIRRFESARAALEALPELAARGGNRAYTACPEGQIAAEWEAGSGLGARLCVLGEAAYPRQLALIGTPPPVVWTLGQGRVFAAPSAAIVGARNASALGLRTARQIARDLGAAGRVVVSGLARGIDAAAHDGSLETGTVAVLPGGLDKIYPPENASLAERIRETGALISECPIGTEATARHFPRRNRLIAGLAAGVLLIEAASRSGSLITARYALEEGREVMACPGSPEDPRSAGGNGLIRDGAALVRDARDVLDALAMPRQPGLAEPETEFLFDAGRFGEEGDDDLAALADFDLEGRAEDAALAEQVVRLLTHTPVEVDEIARICGSRPAELSLVLLELELAGRIAISAGGRIALPDDAE
ncbi:DNA-processing protein DprA [Paralimibaculum aggregatum]|uniref:DNA-processing protein DprA n=1 Tax=Paralimibaculum aggregatum TaxID=3036245 RepID=A0ABQ6LRK9_9RHOB|nr:DNA-processing protein DprA [Limibaculum sp. NKW23]GMG84778.1 DNA-processing protein DprA [Limibaculum sp. NKW23]